MFTLPKKIQYKMSAASFKSSVKQNDYIKEYFYIVALAILFCLIVSVITYDPNDPSTFHRLSNPEQKISNYFGPFGASLADWAFQIFGLGAIIFLIIFIVQLLHTFRRPVLKHHVYLKIFGYPQLILFYLGFVSGIKPFTNFKGIQILTGGVIGNKVFELCRDIFGTGGGLVVLLLGAMSSLTLCLGIKPLSSVLWLLRLAPSKRTKNFAQNVSSDIPPVLEDLFEFNQHVEELPLSSILSRNNQNVFLDLISVLESNEIGSFKNILQSQTFQQINHQLPIAFGRSECNGDIVIDLEKLPNLLIACDLAEKKIQIVNILILSLVVNKTPSELKLILIDPQMLEFSSYEGIGHLFMPIITSAHKCVSMFEGLIEEMEKRYLLLKQFKVRNFTTLKRHVALNHIIVVVSELNDLMISIPYELEANLQKLSLKANSVGIHLVFVTRTSHLSMLTDSIQNYFLSKLYFNENIMAIISENNEEKLPIDLTNISFNEINMLTKKLRDLYPFLSENLTLK